ncbi:MAG: Asp-tRNA(Asn)/Glu-tRNA(Gln) amidotransferase subunit GatC [Spirochaetes bacterium]|nr:Asp-tRNA(Asn)/Glu-tRNA(Gln) amidotransferase subunit GatC [Spirochaetota bacterium]
MLKEELFITANIARLELDEIEAEKLNQAATRMIEHFSLMDKIDVDSLLPTTHITGLSGAENRTREDVPAETSIADKLIENAPERDGRFIIVPNVL